MKKHEIKWEDDDTDFDFESGDKKSGSDEFTELLQNEDTDEGLDLSVGAKVEAIVTSVSETSTDILVELGRKTSGVISKGEFIDDQGGVSVREGDTVQAYIISRQGGECVLSTSMSHSMAQEDSLRTAFESKVPVKGKVTGENKGGFEVTVFGKPAFCPVSAMDIRFVKDKTGYLGKEFDFLITKLEKRNIVLSRKELLKEGQKEDFVKISRAFETGEIVEGVVSEIRDYGLMVDVMSVTGMVHVSQASHSRLSTLSEAFRTGQKVSVKVLDFDISSERPKLSLSIKEAMGDPWAEIDQKVQEGESYTGRVVRLESFGAFVELIPGIEGLVHISEMSWEKRIRHPKDVVSQGDMIEARVLAINPLEKRISLTMKSVVDDPWHDIDIKYPNGVDFDCEVEALKSFGAILKVGSGLTGLIPVGMLKTAFGESFKKKVQVGGKIKVQILEKNYEERKMLLGIPGLKSEDTEDYSAYLGEQAFKKKADEDLGNFAELLGSKLD